jgi:L-threonylcarbamoyladenylate synthase
MSNSPFISNCTASAIRDAALALRAGHLVAFPTETVYGLGADARNPEAIKKIYEVKGRPTDHPLIVHISSLNQLDKWAIDIPEYAIKLARKFWPGPMTLILKRSEIARDFITGGQNTVGLRVPSDPIAQALITEFEKISNSAIAAPSANRFGQVSSTSGSDVFEELGQYLNDDDQILDGGNSTIGIESTIIDCTRNQPVILRSGAVTEENIQVELGLYILGINEDSKIRFSGSFEKHYAPRCRVVLDFKEIEGAGLLALSHVKTPSSMVRLASPNSVEEFARILYSTFRKADHDRIDPLVVCLPEGKGIAVALRERLLKASQSR